MARSSRVGGALSFVLLVSILAVVPSPDLSIPMNPTDVAGGRILSPDFYKDSCPQLEGIVKRAVQATFSVDISIATGLLRIHYHDCVTQVQLQPINVNSLLIIHNMTDYFFISRDATLPCFFKERTASRLYNSTTNLHAGALQLIERIRIQAQQQCGPSIVSCTDITALATREGVIATGGPAYAVNLGQLDSLGPASLAEVYMLPSAWVSSYSELLENFSQWNFSDVHLVALSGAHTLGSAQCIAFRDLDDCARHPWRKQSLDSTPKRFDNQYYVGILNGQGVLSSDRVLAQDSRSLAPVKLFARDQGMFFQAFGEAMFRLSSLRKHHGGEVRNISCFVPNSSRRPLARTGVADDGEGHAALA
ncbi:hypothetical protein EJB05_09549, partial [Eragrostis curvula]